MADRDDDETEEDGGEEFEHIPSELDEASHRELGLIYDDATRTIIFAKGLQWRAVASTLLVHLALVLSARYISNAESFVSLLQGAVILFTTAALFSLIVFQMWQHTEAKKIAVVESNFSSTFRLARNKKWKLEADIHRYLLLFLMIAGIAVTAFIAFNALDRLSL